MMIVHSNLSRRVRRIGIAGAILGALSLMATAASAGQCPAGQDTGDGIKAGATEPVGVTDKVLAKIDLSKEKVGLKDHDLRIRRLVIQPGGVVPWHSHAERPALIYVVSGRIYEHSSTCKVPILHKAGEVATETKATSHWWKNTSSKPVVLLSSDIHFDKHDHNM